MTKRTNVQLSYPVIWSLAFATFDGLWLLIMELIAQGVSAGLIEFGGWWWTLSNWLGMAWNVAHKPIIWFVQPILFPVVTTHPPYPSNTVFLIFYLLGILQFALFGYLLGIVYRRYREVRKS